RGQLDAIGVRIARVAREDIGRPVRAVATVALDESRVSHVHTRVAGWIERLYVNTTGQRVTRGAPLAAIFSQELLASQNEFIALRQNLAHPTTAMATQSLLAATRSRLAVLGMTPAELARVESTGRPLRTVTVVAPRTGVVLHRGIAVGTAVDPSTELLTIADLSRVWVLAEVPEGDIPAIQRDTPARLEFAASGRAPFEARIDFLYPTLTERTRTLRARFVVPNDDGSLRPGLYGEANFQVRAHGALTVPRDAVVDTGETQHVFVVGSDGRFVPRAVTLGTRLDDRVEVREGLNGEESIVASGVFLIDSESRLRASGGGTGHAHGGQTAPAGAAPPDRGARPEPAPSPPPGSPHAGH
ncbi:MAG: efflux RND transporter periplasmic adaptor subunit, partial [Deltaproteobacteria bacterium]|nr:efflux RND transporter periplasmic adaptor subunit [Deltaproteobacteria bacterium]